jgi:glutamate synthase (NADPH) large chain
VSKDNVFIMHGLPPKQGLYDPAFEHDSCGVGFVAHIKGRADNGIVQRGLEMLENMSHRGACGCEPDSGDGAGILVNTPDKFFRRKCGELGFKLPKLGEYACAMVFLPKDLVARRICENLFEKTIRDYDMTVLGWRDVPVNSQFVGPTPKRSEPRIRQCFVGMGEHFYNRTDFNRRMYLVRQRTENQIEFGDVPQIAKDVFYVSLLSTNRMVYKGMLTAHQLRNYYLDLSDPEFTSAIALVHSRFSTNTFPSWRLAHPYRYLAHNGEINTLRGNRNWMRARTGSLQSDVFGDELPKMFPILSDAGSDSSTLDNVMQFLCVNGRSLPHAVLMLIPEAWENDPQMEADLRAFYEYHACLMEPWDGPASVAFTDGYRIGAVLDRNGLRPSRYYVTRDDLVIMASEVGAVPVAPEEVVRKWRLQPGRIFMIDMQKERIVDDAQIKRELVDRRPWRRWLDQHLIELENLPAAQPMHNPQTQASLITRQRAFGYTSEDLKMLIAPMAVVGEEAIGSMGTDTPLACLSDRPQLLYSYFRQLFAQVTNPPLDAMRESLVTSLLTYLGQQSNLLGEQPDAARLVKLKHPILTSDELQKLRQMSVDQVRAATLPILFVAGEGAAGLARALDELCAAADAAVRDGASILILSDRDLSHEQAAISSLLATAAVHHHLIRQGTRAQCGLVIETGEAREAHHLCLLIGYGAGAINPYVAFDTITDLHAQGMLSSGMTLEEAHSHYIKAAAKGILKVASKMGISTVQSYRGAQIFEAIGLAEDVIQKFFTNTASRIRGIGLDVIAAESLHRHRQAFPPLEMAGTTLDSGGQYQWRQDGEYHMYNPDTVAHLQHAVRIESFDTFRQYTKLVDDESQHHCTLRGLLRFKSATPVPLEDVEPASQIVKRFVTGAMSFGSISKEAHENLAIAMNRIGGKSNTGEGGEDPERFAPDSNGDWRRSAIKQVASARFGVTTEYLVNAAELQIKMAQGAKPGEGGALSGIKVDEYIAKVRHSTPGVGLISPPPHHDIYSIEDLAQLIHDLKNVNPAARVSVKLVSEVGVGTIAAGVVKAKADHILISGDGGGTGNAPLTSIKYAGVPWELGLAETQQVLLMNDLRGRVTLQTDGQIKTGRDVVVAALLGAEEIGFSTAPLIVSGCMMMRVCHLNTCPVGIATQDPELRRKFTGKPEHVVNFFFFIAEEVRRYMAELGFRTFEEMVGQTHMLELADVSHHWKARHIDLSPILYRPETLGDVAVRRVRSQDHGLERALDNYLIELAEESLKFGDKSAANMPIKNVNRSVGAMLSGEVARRYGHAGLGDDTIRFKFIGSAGQSFGAFLARGITFTLEGDANDYLGKGLSGGRIVAFPPLTSKFKAEDNIIAGNVIGYGAVDGELYLRGVVGERFCVRNSGANAVVEGVGDHACEYMTGGRVVVLGPTGRNFAAGMSGGIAYVYDDSGGFEKLCNMELCSLEKPDTPEDIVTLRKLLENHFKFTGSTRARTILDDWNSELRWFTKVMPNDYRRVLERQPEMEARARTLSLRQMAGAQ